MYRCSLTDAWGRQIGELTPRAFAHRIGGCQDLIQRLEQYAELDGHSGCVNTVHFSPNGDILVSGSDDMEIVFWDWAAKAKRFSFASGHDNNVFQARIMPFSDDRSVVTCAADGQVRHAQILESGRVETVRLAKHRGRAHKLAIEPGSPRTFFSCGEDGFVRHFDLREKKNTILFACHGISAGSRTHLNAIVINPRNPNYFAVGGSDEYARVYDIRRVNAATAAADGDLSSGNKKDFPVDVFCPKHLIGSKHQVHITCVAFSLQEEILVSYNDELIYLFDKDMGLGPSPVKTQETDAEVKAGAENGGENENSGQQPVVYKGHRNAQTVKGVNFFGPNTEYVVSGSDCGHVFIWKKRGAELVAMMKGDRRVVNCLEPHPFTTVLATSGIEKTVKIWAPTAQEINPLSGEAAIKIMEANKRNREKKTFKSFTPDMLMLRLLARSNSVRRDSSQSAEEDEEYYHGYYEDDDDEDEDDDGGENPECIIS